MSKTSNDKCPKWANRKALTKPEVVARLEEMGEAAYKCAKATGDVDAKAGYMDRYHAMREAVRYLTR